MIYIARFLVDLQIFLLASKAQKLTYPLAIPCRFVDFFNSIQNPKILLSIGNSLQICRIFKYVQKSTYPYAKHCRYSSLSQKLLVGADYMYSAIPCRFVDFPNSIQNQNIFLSIGNSQQICRFFKYDKKSSYLFAKHRSFSHL